jgi:hypothetical protein
MRNFKKIILTIFSFAIIFSCSKDEGTSVEEQIEPNLNGGDTIEQVAETNTEAISKLNELLVENDLTNSLEKLKVWLESSSNISEAVIAGGDIEIKYNSGLSSFVIISLVDEEGNKTRGGGISKSKKNTLVNASDRSTIKIIDNSANHISSINNLGLMGNENIITDRDVLIYDAFQFYFDTKEGQEIEELFENSSLNFNVNYLKDEECTLNSLNNLTDYGFIYFSTHGTNGDIIWTREKVEILDIDKWSLYAAQKLKFGTFVEFEYTNVDGRKAEDRGSFWGVTSSYIGDLNGEFPNSIIFNSSCESTMTNKLYEAFKTKKAKTYLGFDKTVMSDFSKYVGVQFTYGLLNPSSTSNAGDAFNGIVTKRDTRVRIPFPLETDATIEILGEKNMTFHAVDSIPIYEQAVLGEWSVKGLENNPNDVRYELQLYEGGSGQYIGDGTTVYSPPYSMNWHISKGSDGRYYFQDSGFWHYAFNSLSRDALSYPIKTWYKYFDYSDGNGLTPNVEYTKL